MCQEISKLEEKTFFVYDGSRKNTVRKGTKFADYGKAW